MKLLILFAISIITAPLIVNAADIEGKVYDFYLEPVNNAIVEINTEPKQVIVTKDSSYSFSVPQGDYILSASYSNDEEFYYEENLTVKEDGVYNIDIILAPLLEEDEGLEDLEIEFEEPASRKMLYLFLMAATIAVISFLFLKKKKTTPVEHSDELTKSVIKFIKDNGNRTTQKDIREKFPASEAKISLILTELEDGRIIKKIKKGRSNVIILLKNERT